MLFAAQSGFREALGSVDQQDGTVHHLEHALYLTAKVGVGVSTMLIFTSPT